MPNKKTPARFASESVAGRKKETEKQKNEIQEENHDINIKSSESSLVEFTKRPVPTDEQVEEFEDYIEEEAKEEEINESLNEIYHDENGDSVDVKILDIKKRRGFFFWFFSFGFFVAIIIGLGYGGYYYLFERTGSNSEVIDFYLEGKNQVSTGEEFFYTVHYKNLSNVMIRNARIEVKYPENFIFLDSSPEAEEKNSVWTYRVIQPGQSGQIQIKGKLITEEGGTGIVLANISYTPENFSSEFREETSITTEINDMGIEMDFDYLKSALVGEENEILFKFTGKEENFVNNFRIVIEPQENIEFIDIIIQKKDDENLADYEVIRPGVWQINEVTDKEKTLPIRFKFTEKTSDSQEIVLNFEQMDSQNEYHKFFEEAIEYEVMKSDLNLTLIINGARDDQGINSGDTLSYSIVYNNKGEAAMKDVVIMAVLESEWLDWTTLKDENSGRERGNSISWSKKEIEELEVININEEGTIDFSISLAQIGEVDITKEYQVKSYIQYSVGESDKEIENDNKSNTIVNKINSDLKLREQVRYFSEDNIPVGTGPHPPKVGETTTYKVYWDLTNNLHELDDSKITAVLPDYVTWDNKSRSSVGSLIYDSNTQEVKWDIGRLPITVYKSSAEFNISITPTEDDRNKIMVLLSGSEVIATDEETKAGIKQTGKAKTTKLEDDDIAEGDGRIE